MRVERRSASEALEAAQKELQGYRTATGQSLESLRAERANKTALEARTRAQVWLRLAYS